ncbi:unnamed protein product, partial [Urochloa humidicola]
MLGSQAEPSWREFAKPAFAFELEAWWRHSPSRTVLLAAVLGAWPPMRPCAAWLSYATEATAEWRLGKANAMQRTWRPFDAGSIFMAHNRCFGYTITNCNGILHFNMYIRNA